MESICRLKGNGCYMETALCICILNVFRVTAYITYPNVASVYDPSHHVASKKLTRGSRQPLCQNLHCTTCVWRFHACSVWCLIQFALKRDCSPFTISPVKVSYKHRSVCRLSTVLWCVCGYNPSAVCVVCLSALTTQEQLNQKYCSLEPKQCVWVCLKAGDW